MWSSWGNSVCRVRSVWGTSRSESGKQRYEKVLVLLKSVKRSSNLHSSLLSKSSGECLVLQDTPPALCLCQKCWKAVCGAVRLWHAALQEPCGRILALLWAWCKLSSCFSSEQLLWLRHLWARLWPWVCLCERRSWQGRALLGWWGVLSEHITCRLGMWEFSTAEPLLSSSCGEHSQTSVDSHLSCGLSFSVHSWCMCCAPSLSHSPPELPWVNLWLSSPSLSDLSFLGCSLPLLNTIWFQFPGHSFTFIPSEAEELPALL